MTDPMLVHPTNGNAGPLTPRERPTTAARYRSFLTVVAPGQEFRSAPTVSMQLKCRDLFVGLERTAGTVDQYAQTAQARLKRKGFRCDLPFQMEVAGIA